MRTKQIKLNSDRGSVSVWVVIFAAISLLMLALVVDGGQVMIAKTRAADIAEQAARAAADDINQADLQASTPSVQINGDACDRATDLVSQYAPGPRMTASVASCVPVNGAGDPYAQVQVSVSVDPLIPLIFTGTITVTSAPWQAQDECGTADQQQEC